MNPGAAWWRATLLGGAIGDALGAPVEFSDVAAIRARFGRRGITEPVPYEGRLGAITDDTQMTLFTAEGLLAAGRREASYGIASYPYALYYSYLRWMATQGEPLPPLTRAVELRGLLSDCPDLHHRRAPGNTCLSALRHGEPGSVERPLNDSKGCGGIMRAAPGARHRGFDAGVAIAAITHGHPTGYLAAGAFVEILAQLGGGQQLGDAVAAALDRLVAEPHGGETARAVTAARDLASSGEAATPETVERLGAGWIAEEALAIALFAALRADGDAAGALSIAVNHSGDSDSTGAIAGNLIGALLGEDALPGAWVEPLEACDVIVQVANDLAAAAPEDGPAFIEHAERYPYQ